VKKFFIFLCVLVLVAGFAVAQVGVDVGVEFTLNNVNKADGDDWNPVLMPWVSYGTSFGDLDFSTELDYYFDMQPDFDNLEQYLDFDLCLDYTLSLGSASTLLLEVDNIFENVAINPDFGGYVEGTVTPLVKFTQQTDIGSFYVRVAAPIGYFDNDFKYLRSRLGWKSTFGLSLWGQLDSTLEPMEIYSGWRADVNYAADSFTFDVLIRGWKDLSSGLRIGPTFDYYLGGATISLGAVLYNVVADSGFHVDVIPGFEYSVGAIDFYINCTFANIAAESGEVSISPALGVSFSF
jgi:hypothetical protein